MYYCNCCRVVRGLSYFSRILFRFFPRLDEPDEVVVVKQALIAHLDLDPRVTLAVLCDQVMPAAESMMDPDELYMRDRLRTLVLAFLTGEAKEAIVERHAVPDSEAEDVLVGGLLEVGPSRRFLPRTILNIARQFRNWRQKIRILSSSSFSCTFTLTTLGHRGAMPYF
jgi:hypothetical protein